MNKWKAVDTADEGLLSVRAQYQEKMVEFAERWSKVSATRFLFLFGCCCCCCCCAKRGVLSQQYKVEAGQLEVKQNLVKFNNFVREKQGKVD